MNCVMLCGRLTADPTIHNGTMTVSSFSLAVDRKFKKEGEKNTDYFKCTSFGKQADFVQKYLTKGIKIIVRGRIQNDNYEKDGVKHYGVQIITEEIEFAESKGNKETSGKENFETNETTDEWMNIPDNIDAELPFN